MPRARLSARSPVGRTKSNTLLALFGAFLYILVAIVSASTAFIVVDPSGQRQFHPARLVLGALFAALAFVVLDRIHFASPGDFSLIATITFLTGLFVDALVGDTIRAGMRPPA